MNSGLRNLVPGLEQNHTLRGTLLTKALATYVFSSTTLLVLTSWVGMVFDKDLCSFSLFYAAVSCKHSGISSC